VEAPHKEARHRVKMTLGATMLPKKGLWMKAAPLPQQLLLATAVQMSLVQLASALPAILRIWRSNLVHKDAGTLNN